MSSIEDAQKSAADWINTYPAIEILSISTCVSEWVAAVTVWYRA